MNKTNKKPGNRSVLDDKGNAYKLTGVLGKGGQGTVCSTDYLNVLVKISNRPGKDPRTREWFEHLQWIARQSLEGLHIARPQALIVKPQLGYVMELMDGLEPLNVMLECSVLAMREGAGAAAYCDSGGVSRRVRVLARLARSLASLHGRALVYGDLSPANVYVSKSHQYHEVWLIDCDNICALSREGGQRVYTPDYGAPEILRGESGVNSLTDSWTFAVLAFQLLTLVHPLKGLMVSDGEPDMDEQALQGQLPWIDHPSDDRNRAGNGLPREQVLTLRLQKIFEQCFNAGLNDPGERPSMAAWAEAFEEAAMLLADCNEEDGCGSSFLFNPRRECPFCGHIQSAERFLLLRHFVFAPLSDLGEDAEKSDQWMRTGDLQLVCMGARVELHSSPVGSSTYAESAVVGSLELTEEGLWIESLSSIPLALLRKKTQRSESERPRTLLKTGSRLDAQLALHIGDMSSLHAVWRFKW